MSDIHILEGSFSNVNGYGSYKVVFHIPLIIKNYPIDDSKTSVVPGIDAKDLDNIKSGTIHEFVENINFNKEISEEVMLDKVRSRWFELQAQKNAQLTSEYKYYNKGFSKE